MHVTSTRQVNANYFVAQAGSARRDNDDANNCALFFQWYRVDKNKIREDLLDLWVPLGTGPNADQPDKAAEIFLVRSAERSDSLPLQAWHSLARSALSWFISRTSING